MITWHKRIVGLTIFFLMITSADAYEFPPYRGLKVKLIGNIVENYTNNVTYASDNENRIEDYRTMVKLGLDFQYTGKKHFYRFSGMAHRQIFEESSDNLNKSENFDMIFINEFTKYDKITLQNTYRHTMEPGRITGDFDLASCIDSYENFPLSSSDIELLCSEFNEQFGRFSGVFDSYSNDFSIKYYKGVSDILNFAVKYNYVKNGSSAEGTNDSDRNKFGLLLNYHYSQTTSYALSYNYVLSNYEKGNDISTKKINAGVTQYITKGTSFTGSIGKIFVSSGRDSIEIKGGISVGVDEKTSANISYSQGIRITNNTNDTFKNWRLSGTLIKAMLKDLNGSLSVFYGKGEYSETDVIDTLQGASINLSYVYWEGMRGSKLGMNIGYSYSNTDSTVESREYTKNSINSGMTLAF